MLCMHRIRMHSIRCSKLILYYIVTCLFEQKLLKIVWTGGHRVKIFGKTIWFFSEHRVFNMKDVTVYTYIFAWLSVQ